MTLQQMEYVLAVDKHRHFAKAAEFCGVTQPTLSAMIQKLEDELGVKIFDRQMQPVCPTKVGAKIIAQIGHVQMEVSRVKDIVSEEVNSYQGTFKLGVLPTIAPYLLPRFFPQLSEKYPGLDLRVYERKTPEITADLLNGDLDAAIWATEPDVGAIVGETIFYDEFFGYVARKEKLFKSEVIRTSEVTGEHLWLLDEGHCFRDQLLRFCQMDSVKHCQMSYRLGGLETFMRMVENGQGITFIPELATYQLTDVQKELLRPFAIPRPTRRIMLVHHKDSVRHSVFELLKHEIRNAVPKHMHNLQPVQTPV